MPHHPQPFFRKSRSCWYVQPEGKQISLGSIQEAVFDQHHQLMAELTDPSCL